MKSICKFELKSEYENYQNEVNMLAHVVEENKVYLRLGRLFSFCIHGYFEVPSNNSVIKILGDNVALDNFASLKFTNLDTGEVKSESSSINRTATLTQGNWRIDYGLYKRDTGFYVAPALMFDNGITVNYIQVDPIITLVSALFIRHCPLLTGAMFGELDLYPEVRVFDGKPYSRNDVILLNIAFTNNDSTNFLGGNGGCPLIKNVYVGDTVTGFVGCFGHIDANGKTLDSSIKSLVYIGKLVLLPSTDLGNDYLNFINQNKITKFIVSPENPNFIYDDTVQALIRKDTSDGKIIAAGVGTFRNDMLQIPAGYRMRNYRCYLGRAPIIVDLSEFDDYNHTLKNKLMGIRDLNKAELVILPKNLETIEIYHGAGLSNCETLIVPTKVAPICQWGNGNLGDRTSVYKGAFSTVSNMSGYGLGGNTDKTKRKLYVIEGTAEEKATWTNKYDNWPNPPANTWQNGTTGNWERPNLWHDLTLSYNLGDYKSLWNEASGPYQEFEIIFVPENEMDTLILTKILEKLTEIQNRSN